MYRCSCDPGRELDTTVSYLFPGRDVAWSRTFVRLRADGIKSRLLLTNMLSLIRATSRWNGMKRLELRHQRDLCLTLVQHYIYECMVCLDRISNSQLHALAISAASFSHRTSNRCLPTVIGYRESVVWRISKANGRPRKDFRAIEEVFQFFLPFTSTSASLSIRAKEAAQLVGHGRTCLLLCTSRPQIAGHG